MKGKIKKLFLVLPILVGLILSCEEDELSVPIEGIQINGSDIQLGIGEVHTLTVSKSPENATDDGVTWSSSDENVAQIQFNESGLVAGVMGMGLGEAILTAKPDNGAEQTVAINVITKVESIEFVEEMMADPAQTQYNVVFTPADASIQDLEWSSSDSGVASVVDGLITAIAPGVTTITATTVEGGKTASVEINVSGNPAILGFQYCSVSGTGSYNPDTVQTSGGGQNLNNTDTQPSGNYNYYEGEKVQVAPGGSFDLSVVQSNNWSMTVVWVDWNGDKDFVDDGEQVAVFGLQAQLNDGPFNATINVPADASPGLVRMRVLTGDAWTTEPSAAPCGEVANSTTKDFDVEIVGVLYCQASGTGAYNADSLTTTGGDTNINYSGGQPSGNYEFFTDEHLSLNAGASFTLEVVQSNNWSRTMVWVDWNGDGDFEDDGEQVLVFGLGSQLNDGPFNSTIDVPADAVQGTIRMRVVTGDAWSYDPIPDNVCGELANSTTKDFNVEIL
ncbi:GEVED domain-containing protein [Flagellimonas pacifica]|uniref:Ig-like domain (Group 2) n=1 Tax=Flagellimonas pacifica TaxID=1247520 RepID=A0A285MSL2_9FLAO|nr:GEVED domain-containing protein [Allomuricauda parva]SNY99517.1 Ig-like domain (group 2) [Allomuricauda parva]